MKRILFSISVTLLVLSAGLARAQSGALCIFSDTGGTECSFQDNAAALMQFYVVHTETPAATASEFWAPLPACMTGATYLSDTSPFSVFIGNSQTGISIAYGACLVSPIHVLTINVFATGLTQPDCAYPVLGHPDTGEIQMVDCNYLKHPASGGIAYINSSIPCECVAAPLPPVLNVSPTSLQFGLDLTSLDVEIRNFGGGTLDWSTSTSDSWLSTSPSSGTGDGTVSVMVDRTGLPGDAYLGTVTISSNGGNVNVSVLMSTPGIGPVLSVSPTSLSFPASITNQSFNISNAGDGDLSWTIDETIPWLSTSPTSGVNDWTVQVDVDRTGLADGTYTGDIFVHSNGGEDTVSVDMEVPPPMPALGFSPTSLSFAATIGQLPLSIFNNGTGTLSWSITPSESWVSVNPPSGDGDQTVYVTVDRSGLADGTYSADLAITSNGGSGNVPMMVSVASAPILVVDPTLLVFNQYSGTQTFDISNGGVGTLDWSMSATEPWIVILPPLVGSGNATVSVQVDRTAVPAGQQTGYINVTSNGGSATVTVRYNPVSTYPGYLMLAGDPQGASCSVQDATPGLLRIYVVHTGTPGATACNFSAPAPGCMNLATYLSDEYPFSVVIGNSQTGLAVAYGACLASPIHVVTMNFFSQGLTPPCCFYELLPNPNSTSGQIETVDCAQNLQYTFGALGVVNETAECPCSLVKVEQSSWGAIKSLYAPQD